jgi:hypothetical protein
MGKKKAADPPDDSSSRTVEASVRVRGGGPARRDFGAGFWLTFSPGIFWRWIRWITGTSVTAAALAKGYLLFG